MSQGFGFEPEEKSPSAKSKKGVLIPDSVTAIGIEAFEDCPDLIIYGKSGSSAEKYAREEGFSFQAV